MDKTDDLFRDIDAHFAEAVAALVRLCRQPSVSAQKLGYPEATDLVAAQLREAGLAVSVLPTEGDFPVVYGQLRGRSNRTLLFYNHYDVQPPEPLDLWTSPPFEPRIANDHLYARGAADNKGDIVARLAAVQAVRRVYGTLPVTLRWIIEGEEEIGSPHLPAFVEAHRNLLTADGCIWEGHEVDWQGRPHIVLGAKGLLYVRLEAHGASRDVHSSYATVVPNPAWRLIWALNTLKDTDERVLVEGFYDAVRPPSEADQDALSRLPLEDQAARDSLGRPASVRGVSGVDYYHRHLFEPTCNIAGLESGYTGPGAKTVLPSLAYAKLDFRLVPDQDPDDILAKLRRHLDRHGFSDVAVSAAMGGEKPARTPADSAFIALLADCARRVYEAEAVLVPTMAGTGPMHSFTDTLGLPVAGAGVAYPDCRMHAPDENIRLPDLAKGIKLMALLLVRMGETS